MRTSRRMTRGKRKQDDEGVGLSAVILKSIGVLVVLSVYRRPRASSPGNETGLNFDLG